MNKSSRKYATNILNLATGRVQAYKMPVTFANRLVARAERNGGTITNRDYTVIRTGDGLETEYDVEQDEKYDIDFATYKASFIDIENLLADSYREVWGSVSEVVEKPAAKKVEEVPPSKPAVVSNAQPQSDDIDVKGKSVSTMQFMKIGTMYSKSQVSDPAPNGLHRVNQILRRLNAYHHRLGDIQIRLMRGNFLPESE